MDTASNPTPSSERPNQSATEHLNDLQMPEQAPQPAANPQNTGQPSATPPQLNRDQVAAAIAAMPGPGQQASPTPAGPPAVANDQDVVEPEWVDAAEHAITQTAGNPYAEEEAVESLQVDYLKKRYGFEVKKPDKK